MQSEVLSALEDGATVVTGSHHLARAFRREYNASRKGRGDTGRVEGVDGRTVLVGARQDGRTVEVSGMSDGTCDQLYFALRVASLEHYFDAHEHMPFIVDDVLLSFDDERASSALSVLNEMSAKTQVVFYTHHQHLLDLAESATQAAVMKI